MAARERRGWGDWRLVSSLTRSCPLLSGLANPRLPWSSPGLPHRPSERVPARQWTATRKKCVPKMRLPNRACTENAPTEYAPQKCAGPDPHVNLDAQREGSSLGAQQLRHAEGRGLPQRAGTLAREVLPSSCNGEVNTQTERWVDKSTGGTGRYKVTPCRSKECPSVHQRRQRRLHRARRQVHAEQRSQRAAAGPAAQHKLVREARSEERDAAGKQQPWRRAGDAAPAHAREERRRQHHEHRGYDALPRGDLAQERGEVRGRGVHEPDVRLPAELHEAAAEALRWARAEGLELRLLQRPCGGRGPRGWS
eukprot:356105-Chlamydomonas_euryale.AAC.1